MSERAIAAPLAGRTILVTRPADQSAALVDAARTPRRAGDRRARDRDRARAFGRAHPSPEAIWRPGASPGSRSRAARPSTMLAEPPAARRRARRGRRDRRRHRGGLPLVGGARAGPAADDLHDRRRSRAPSRKGIGRVLCARADIAPEGLEDGARREGMVARAGRRLPHADAALAPRRGARRRCAPARSTRSRSRAPRPCAASSGRSAPCAGTPKVVCIGPVTAKEARAHGLTVHAVAQPPHDRGRGRRGRAGAQAATAG